MIKGLVSVTRTNTGLTVPFTSDKGPNARVLQYQLQLSAAELASQEHKPVAVAGMPGWWLYRNTVVVVEPPDLALSEEAVLEIKHAVLRREKMFRRMKRDVEAFERMESTATARRDRIPESVRLFVWQRDEGKCVRCGSQERLEFDHIIPIGDGGSSTERNVQLLCEACNRAKGRSV